MAKTFQLTAQLNIVGPVGLNSVVGNLKKSLTSVPANIAITIPPASITSIRNTTRYLQQLSATLKVLNVDARNVSKAMNALATSINSVGNASKALTTFSKSLGAINKTSANSAKSLEDFGKQAALALKRFSAYTIATGVIYGVGRAFTVGIKDALEFQREMVRLTQVTGKSAASLQDLRDEITRLSRDFGVSSKELSQVSVTLAQAGFSANDVKKSLEALAKSSLAPTFTSIEQTTEGAIAAMAQFKIEAKDLEGVLGSINQVSAQFAVESDDLITVIRRSGGAFKAAGGNLNELLALFTSVRATTRESAESIATGFRTIFTRLQRKDTIDLLKQFGVELRDVKDQFVGPLEAVQKLSAALNSIPSTDPRFSQIVEELGGFRQISKVIPLIQQYAITQKALGVAEQGTTSLTKDATLAQQALLVQVQKVKEEFADLFRTIANDAAIQGLIKGFLAIASSVANLSKALVPLIPFLATAGLIKGAAGAVKFGGGFRKSLFGFAGGGVVPGEGNTDSVPARLTPGEFVIKKSSAKAIGYDTLSKVNKYAGGGIVRVGGEGTNSGFGALVFQPDPKTNNQDQIRSASVGFGGKTGISETAQRALASKLNVKYDSLDKVIGDPQLFYINEDARPLFNNTVKPAVDQLMKSVAVKMGGGLPDNLHLDPDALFQAAGGNDLLGKIFEGSLKILNKTNPTSNQDSFDLPSGVRTSFLGKLFSANGNIPTNLDAKFTGTQDAVRNLVKKATNSALFEGTLPVSLISGLQKKASGGSVTDTIPAMLTPGEFVVNKKSAAKIGYGKLNQMNKYGAVAGYAHGGTVSHFAQGTPIGQPFPLSNATNTSVTSILDRLTKVTGSAAAAMQILASATADGALVQPRLNKVTGEVTYSLAGLSKATKDQIATAIKVSKVNTQATQQATKGSSTRNLATLGLITAIAGNQAINGILGTVGTNNTSGLAKVGSGLQGALTGGATGAALGSAIAPGIGTVIGGVGGALAGLVTSLRQAEKDIKDIKLGKDIDNILSGLGKISSQGFVGPADLANGNKLIGDVLKQRGNISSLEDLNRIDDGLSSTRQSILDFGQGIAKNVRTIEEFRTAANSVIEALAVIDKVSSKNVVDSFSKLIDAQNKSRDIQNKINNVENVRIQIAQQVASFGSALADATNNIRDISGSVDLNGGGPFRTTGFGDVLSRPGRTSNSALFGQAVSSTGSLFGGDNSALIKSAKEFQNASVNLPTVITKLATSPQIEGENVIAKLEEELKNAGIGEELRNIIADQANTFGAGIDDFLKEATVNPEKTASRLLEGLDGVIKILEEAEKAYHGVVNRYLDNIANSVQKQAQIEQQKLKLDDLAVSKLKTQKSFSGERTDPGAFNAIFNRRQDALIGVGGIAGNAGAINSRLQGQLAARDSLRSRITEAERSSAPNKSETIAGFAEELRNTENNISNLNTALERLTDVAGRTAAAQERLGEIEKSRSELRSLGEKLTFGNTADLRQLSKDLSLTLLASKKGIGAIPQNLRGGVLGLVGGLGNTPLGAFGGKTGQKALDAMIQDFIGGKGGAQLGGLLGNKPQGEETLLRESILKAFDEATKAQDAVIKNQENVNNKFISDMNKEFTSFIKELKLSTVNSSIDRTRGQLTTAQIGQSTSETRLNSLSKLQKIVGGDITTNPQGVFNRANAAKALIDRSQSATNSLFDTNRFIDKNLGTPEGFKKFASQKVSDQRFQISSLPKDVQDKILEQTDKYQNKNVTANSRISNIKGFVNSNASAVGREYLDVQAEKKAFPDLDKIASSYSTLSSSLSDLSGVDVTSVSRDLSRFTDQISRLKTTLSQEEARKYEIENPVGKAGGGSIFKPRGSDTVPAMLTPGEYVINARQAQANAGILDEINYGSGTIYSARGGPTRKQILAERRKAYKAQQQARREAYSSRFRQDVEEPEREVTGGAGDFASQALFGFAAKKLKEKKVFENQTRAFRISSARLPKKIGTPEAPAVVFAGINYGNLPEDERNRLIANRKERLRRRDIAGIKFDRLTPEQRERVEPKVAGAPRRENGINYSGLSPEQMERINAGKARRAKRPATGRSGGGKVAYYAAGGQVGGNGVDFSALNTFGQTFAAQVTIISQSFTQLSNALSMFNSNASQLAEKLSTIPTEITMRGQHTLHVDITGAEAFASMEDKFKKMLTAEIDDKLSQFVNKYIPEAKQG